MPSIKRKNLKKIVFLKNKKKILSSLYTVPAEKKKKTNYNYIIYKVIYHFLCKYIIFLAY
jgi:hypothetical protein